MWESADPQKDVELIACVVWDEKNKEYYTFLTTDTGKTAKQIIQTYELSPESEFSGKSLPVIIKNYVLDKPKSVIIYVGQSFGIFPFIKFIQLYANLSLAIRSLLNPILALV